MENPELRQREDGRDVVQLVRVERREEGVGREEQDGVRVVHDVMDVVGAEVGEDRDDDGAVRDGGEPDDRPARGVAPEEGDLVAGRDAADPEDLVEPHDLVRDLRVGQRPAFPVRERGTRPVPPHALVDETDEALLRSGRVRLGVHGTFPSIISSGRGKSALKHLHGASIESRYRRREVQA